MIYFNHAANINKNYGIKSLTADSIDYFCYKFNKPNRLKRRITTFPHTDIDKCKQQLLVWSKRYSHAMALDSNEYPHQEIYYDFMLATDPISTLQQSSSGAFDELQKKITATGDWLFGYLSYDLKNDIETIQSTNKNHLEFPEILFFQPKRVWILKNGHIEAHYPESVDPLDDWELICSIEVNKPNTHQHNIQLKSRISRADYLRNAESLQKHIARGDIYEVNFCMELFADDVEISPISLFQQLNASSKSPFAAFLQANNKFLLSSSPERFLKRVGDRLISQPIKGTAKRHQNQEDDLKAAKQLISNEKERAENTMIVDLVRNDMARVAKKGSVQVEELCKVYPFTHVHQMISTVSANLRPEIDVIDAIRACFPMGSMTGAPKLRAMQLIDQYETTKRGLYSGAVGYIDPNGDFDFNVVIRSLQYRSDTKYLSVQVGSALTAASEPVSEYDECMLKAKGIMKVLHHKMTINL